MKRNRRADYYLVYQSDAQDMRQTAERLADWLAEQTRLGVAAAEDAGHYRREILLGKTDRPVIPQIEAGMDPVDGYCYGAAGDAYVVHASDRFGLIVGMIKLVSLLKQTEPQKAGITYGRLCELPRDDAYLAAVALAKRVYGTYGSRVEKMLADHRDTEAIADQALVKALIRRMGGSMAVSIGSSSVLYRGFVRKLDPTDYSRTAKRSPDGHILIPAAWGNRYFGEVLSADENGYADLTVCCKSFRGYTLFDDTDRELAVVTPSGETGFADPLHAVDGYTNRAYLDRMNDFFHNPVLPEPHSNAEQTRVEIVTSRMEPQFEYDCTQATWETHYSPAICTMDREDGGTDIYAAYEYRRIRNFKGIELPTTYLKRSGDGGKTWEPVAGIYMLCNASLFVHQGKVWLIGFRNGRGNVMLSSLDPQNGELRTGELDFDAGLRAPGTVLFANGRFYCAFNNTVISVDAQDDFMNSSNWTRSNNPQELLSRADFERLTGETTGKNNIFWIEEGNVVKGPDGELYILYRLDAAPTYGYAVIFHLSADGRTLSTVKACGSVIHFPYTQSKFSVRYEETLRKYISLTSLATAGTMVQRNVLGLVVSDDLLHWQVVDVLLVDREMINNTVSRYSHAFQYVDFTFSGGDLLFVVREAGGETFWFHDGNCITMYTLCGYTDFIRKRLSGLTGEAT